MTGGRGRGRAVSLCLLVVAGVVSTAAAQPAQPADQAPTRRASVTALLDVFGGWDESLTPGRPLATGGAVDSTTYGGANSAILYGKAFTWSAVDLRLSAAGRYLPRARPVWMPSYGADLSWASVGRRRWSWSLAQSASYRPPNAGVLFAGGLGASALNVTSGLPVDGVDYLLSDARELATSTSGSLGFALTRRDRFTIAGGGGAVVGSSGNAARYRRLSGSASLDHSLSRYGGLRLGYRYDESQSFDAQSKAAGRPKYRIHGVDAGVHYARPLPFSRETTVAFSSGFVGIPRTGTWEYTAIGSGAINRVFKRRWTASLNGERTVRFVPTFAEATLVNAVSAGLGGSQGRRMSFNIGANYATGRSGYRDTAIPFDAYSGQAQWRVAASRRLGLFVEYFYFLASIQGAAQSAYPRGELSRHGVRVGGSFGTDLIGRR